MNTGPDIKTYTYSRLRAALVMLSALPLLFFAACGGGGGGSQSPAVAVPAASLRNQCVQSVNGAANNPNVNSNPADPNALAANPSPTSTPPPGVLGYPGDSSPFIHLQGAPGSCDYEATPNANTPACQQFAQYKSMTCKFDRIGSDAGCASAAAAVNAAATSAVAQGQQTNLTNLQTAAHNASGASSCVNDVQQAMAEWATYDGGKFANTPGGCSFLDAYAPSILESLGGQVGATPTTQATLAGVVAANPSGGCTNPVNGPCRTANYIQNYLCGFNAITSVAGTAPPVATASPTGSPSASPTNVVIVAPAPPPYGLPPGGILGLVNLRPRQGSVGAGQHPQGFFGHTPTSTTSFNRQPNSGQINYGGGTTTPSNVPNGMHVSPDNSFNGFPVVW